MARRPTAARLGIARTRLAQRKIAEALGVTEGAASQWISRENAQGPEALRYHPSPGAPPKLTPEQSAQLPTMLAKGTEAYGFQGEVWTAARVAIVIWGEISSDPLQLSPQSDQTPCPEARKPSESTRCAVHPDLAQPASGRGKEKAEEEARTIIFVDESAFYLLPMAVRTYATVGKTPILSVPLTCDHLSAIGALTPDGRLFMQIQAHLHKGPNVVRLLHLLLRKIPGKLLVIWDGAPMHRSNVIKAFLSVGGATRIHLELLPAYAPELNPQ